MTPIVRRSGDTATCIIPAMRLISRTNTHRHWVKDFLATTNHRMIVRSAFKGIARRPEWAAATGIRVGMRYVGPRKMDQGNIAAAFKNVQDGVADAFKIDDGRDDFWTWEYACAVVGKGEEPFVSIALTMRAASLQWAELPAGEGPGHTPAWCSNDDPVSVLLEPKAGGWMVHVDLSLSGDLPASDLAGAQRAAAQFVRVALGDIAFKIGKG
jgi:hypothetical protein